MGGETTQRIVFVMDKIIDAAKQTGANAFNPGYGFLWESRICTTCNR
ncbi:MAG: hypothetical protein IPJ22_00015 [Bacteroidetes bacterium]|nr:hypothetical protein [Bacteroidota bacterium]